MRSFTHLLTTAEVGGAFGRNHVPSGGNRPGQPLFDEWRRLQPAPASASNGYACRARSGRVPPTSTAIGHGPSLSQGRPARPVRLFLEGVRTGQGGWIVTPNLDILRQFTADPESRELVLAASHRVADGQPIVWASRLAGTPLPERVPGSDLVLSMPEAAAAPDCPCSFWAGTPAWHRSPRGGSEARYPGLQRSGIVLPAIRIRG